MAERSSEKRPQCFEVSAEIIAKDSWQKIVGKDFLLIPLFLFLTSYLQLPHLGQGNVTIHCCLLCRIAPVSISHVPGDASYLFWDSDSIGKFSVKAGLQFRLDYMYF